MQRRLKALLFIAIVPPILMGLSIFLIIHTPQTLLSLSHSLYIYPAIIIGFLFFIGKRTTVKNHIQNKPLTPIAWFAKILIIQVFAVSLFAGQFFTLGQYEVRGGLLTKAQFHPWFFHLLSSFFSSWNLVLWAFILVAFLLFYYARNKLDTPHALTDILPCPNNTLGRLFKIAADNYLAHSTRLLICCSIVIASLQISLFIYPDYNPMLNALFSIFLTGLMLFLSTTNIMRRIFKTLHNKKLPPSLLFILYLLISTLIILLIALLMAKIRGRTTYILTHWHSLSLFSASELPIIDHLTMIAWWIMATPLLASLLFMVSHRKTLKEIIIAAMLLPITFSLFACFFTHYPQDIQISHATFFVFQMIGLLGLLILLSHRSAHRILWFGYFTDAPLKKLRIMQPSVFWQLMACFTGLFAVMNGMPALYIVFSLVTLGSTVIYLLLLTATVNHLIRSQR